MKKLKYILISMVAAIAFVFMAVTGIKVNAAEECNVSTSSSGTMEKGNTYVLSASKVATAEGYSDTASGKTFIYPYYEYFTLGISSNWNVDYNTNLTGGVGIRSNGSSNRTVSFTIPSGETATVTIGLYTNDKSKTNSLTYGDISKSTNSFNSNYVVVSESTSISAGVSTITFPNKMGFTSITVEVSGTAASEEELIAAAETAINAIGTVTYSTESKTLINAATVAVSKVTNPSTSISNYSTYTAAQTAFSTAENNKVDAFINAVDAIGTVTAESGSAITAAETAYDELFGDTLTKTNVVTAKATLDSAKTTYAELVYDTYDKYYSTPSEITTATLTEDTQMGKSIFTATSGMCTKDSATLTIGNTTWTTRYYTNGSSKCSSTDKTRLIYFKTKTSGSLKLAVSSQNSTAFDRNVELYNSSYTKIASKAAQVSNSIGYNKYMYFDIPAADTYYIGTSAGINFFYLEFIPDTSYDANDVTLSFDAQYDAATDTSATKLRFIGTIEGIAYTDYAKIDTMEFRFTFNSTDRTCATTSLYKSIVSGSTTVKATADNTMYTVFQLNNINKTAYKGLVLSNCAFVVTFVDGSTAIINHADITLPEFTTVVA